MSQRPVICAASLRPSVSTISRPQDPSPTMPKRSGGPDGGEDAGVCALPSPWRLSNNASAPVVVFRNSRRSNASRMRLSVRRALRELLAERLGEGAVGAKRPPRGEGLRQQVRPDLVPRLYLLRERIHEARLQRHRAQRLDRLLAQRTAPASEETRRHGLRLGLGWMRFDLAGARLIAVLPLWPASARAQADVGSVPNGRRHRVWDVDRDGDRLSGLGAGHDAIAAEPPRRADGDCDVDHEHEREEESGKYTGRHEVTLPSGESFVERRTAPQRFCSPAAIQASASS